MFSLPTFITEPNLRGSSLPQGAKQVPFILQWLPASAQVRRFRIQITCLIVTKALESGKGFNVLLLDSAACGGGGGEQKKNALGALQLAAHRTDSKATAMASRGVTGDAS